MFPVKLHSLNACLLSVLVTKSLKIFAALQLHCQNVELTSSTQTNTLISKKAQFVRSYYKSYFLLLASLSKKIRRLFHRWPNPGLLSKYTFGPISTIVIQPYNIFIAKNLSFSSNERTQGVVLKSVLKYNGFLFFPRVSQLIELDRLPFFVVTVTFFRYI